jgi:hypothetical protein
MAPFPLPKSMGLIVSNPQTLLLNPQHRLAVRKTLHTSLACFLSFFLSSKEMIYTTSSGRQQSDHNEIVCEKKDRVLGNIGLFGKEGGNAIIFHLVLPSSSE